MANLFSLISLVFSTSPSSFQSIDRLNLLLENTWCNIEAESISIAFWREKARQLEKELENKCGHREKLGSMRDFLVRKVVERQSILSTTLKVIIENFTIQVCH